MVCIVLSCTYLAIELGEATNLAAVWTGKQIVGEIIGATILIAEFRESVKVTFVIDQCRPDTTLHLTFFTARNSAGKLTAAEYADTSVALQGL